MKTLKQCTVLLLLLLQTIVVVGQENDLSIFNDKYNSSLQKENKGIAILTKKAGNIQSISLGNYNLNENSVFNIGSATKTFTAILLLQEVEKGNLKLTDSIGSFLSPIKNVDGTLSIGTLLKHESGLDEVVGKNILDIFYGKNDSVYTTNLLDEIEENNPDNIGKFSYCNTNYLVLGKIIEKITDKSYFDVLRERIFMPLQMENTYPYLSKTLKNLATPTHKNEDATEFLDHRFFTIANAAGSIASTLNDMEKFYTALFETEKILKKETVALMLESGSKEYGLGIEKYIQDGEIYYGHGGNNIGYAFRNAYDPKSKNMLLLFSNSIIIPSRQIIKNDLLNYLNDKPIENITGVDIEKFREYAGTYLIKEANLTLKVVLENEKMFLEVASQGIKSELKQKDDNTLQEFTVGVSLSRIEDNYDSLLFSQNGFSTTINKVTSKN